MSSGLKKLVDLSTSVTILFMVDMIRKQYFPNRLAVGDCITVCILVGAILQQEHNCDVKLVHGVLDDCFHTWLEVNSVGIDPCTDCTTVTDGREFVTFTVDPGYSIRSKDPFSIDDYYPGVSLDGLKEMLPIL